MKHMQKKKNALSSTASGGIQKQVNIIEQHVKISNFIADLNRRGLKQFRQHPSLCNPDLHHSYTVLCKIKVPIKLPVIEATILVRILVKTAIPMSKSHG